MTHAMPKGSNIQLETAPLCAVLCWSPGSGAPDVDVSALLLDERGRVRSDADFVFYNQPRHPAGAVRHLPRPQGEQGAPGPRDAVEANLAAMESGVDRVLLAASADGGTFADVRELRLLLYAGTAAQDGEPAGEPLVQFDIVPETGSETALICGELYRRESGWKFRALGQGYDTGLTGLATDFGISVEEGQEASGERPDAPAPAAPAPSDPDADVTVPAVALPQPPAQPAVPPVPAAPPAAPPAHAAQEDFPLPAPAAASSAPYAAGPQSRPRGGYGYPQAPAQPQQPPSTRPAYGYPQPTYGYPQPDPNFALPPQGPQFLER